MSLTPTSSALFDHIAQLQGARPWGRFLDAGAGVHSTRWSLGLKTEGWMGVTASEAHARQILARTQGLMGPDHQLKVANWADPALLDAEQFDTVLADYLIGAVEAFAPYYQDALIARLRPHLRGRLYVVGLDPYTIETAQSPAAQAVRAIGRFRDACILLADEIPYREFPAEWVADRLEAAGLKVLSARRFPNRYREAWVHGQIDMGLRRLSQLTDQTLASAMRASGESLRERALQLCQVEDGLRHGADYVLMAEPADT